MNELTIRLVLTLALVFSLCEATHFYGGTMSAVPYKDKGTNVTVVYNNHFAYKRTNTSFGAATWCNDTTINTRAIFGVSENIKCIRGCRVANETVGTTLVYCAAYSVSENWSYGTSTFNYSAPKSGNYSITYASGAFGLIMAVGYNATGTPSSASWQLTLTLNLLNRSDTHVINTTPVTLISPFISVPKGIQYALKIPFIDADADTVRCKQLKKKS
jgi:hypothetical protein